MSGGRRAPRLESIELQDVSVRLGRQWALRNVTLELRSGQRWLLVGGNGAGKTVLLKLLRGDVWPTPTGRERRRYRIGADRHEQPLFARERIAYLGPEAQDKFERYGWNQPVASIVGTGLFDTDILLNELSRGQAALVVQALQDVDLAGLAKRSFLSLSYGQRRRVLLARALVRRPDVLLLDEALNGLDARSRAALLRSLRRTSTPGICWMLSTHRMADVPRGVTHIATLERGRLVTATVQGRVAMQSASRRRSAATIRRRGRAGSGKLPIMRAPGPSLRARASTLIELRNVSVFRDYRPVLENLGWRIESGEHWHVSGANGSGKSTLIALLYGDLSPAYGGGIKRRGIARGQPVSDWKRRVGLVSPELQATYAAGEFTLLDVALSGLHSSIGLNAAATDREIALARSALRKVGIDVLRDRRARQVSYGQLRLALWARALIAPRELLLLDEPFDGLAEHACAIARKLLEAAVADGTQVVIATHHSDDVPAFVTRTFDLGSLPGVTSRR